MRLDREESELIVAEARAMLLSKAMTPSELHLRKDTLGGAASGPGSAAAAASLSREVRVAGVLGICTFPLRSPALS